MPMKPPQVLVVGAGAVGQVFGRHLQLGGARVTFFVREKYLREVAQGFTLYPLNRGLRAAPEHFQGFDAVSTPGEVARTRFEQVFLTVSSPAVRGPWLPALVHAIGDATVVSLQPSPDDRTPVRDAGVPGERLVSGLISLISYAAPLPGETRFTSPGTAYWFPPLMPSLFSGPRERTTAVVGALSRGGLPAKIHPDVPRAVAFPTAIMMAYLTALEGAGWSLRAASRSGQLALGARGAREATAIVARTQGRPPLWARFLSWPSILRLGLWFGERVCPFPLERYLEKHFTKVGDQTRLLVSSMISSGKQAGLEVSALERLMAERSAR